MPTFKEDRIGATAALHRVLKNLIDNDEIRELGVGDKKRFSTTARSFMVSAPERFLEAGRMKFKGGV